MTYLAAPINTNELTMSSIDLLEIINTARLEQGETAIRRNDFSARVADELDGDHYETFVVGNPNGTKTTAYLLTSDQSMLVSMRESKVVRRSVLEKLKALDEPKEPTWIASLSPQARIAIADLNQQVEQQQILIEQSKPAVEFVERYVSADSGSRGFRQVCKLLKAKQPEFRAFLVSKKIMYRLGSEWTAYQGHIDAGRFETKTDVADNGHAFSEAKFTAKGVNWICGLWAIHNIQEAA